MKNKIIILLSLLVLSLPILAESPIDPPAKHTKLEMKDFGKMIGEKPEYRLLLDNPKEAHRSMSTLDGSLDPMTRDAVDRALKNIVYEVIVVDGVSDPEESDAILREKLNNKTVDQVIMMGAESAKRIEASQNK